MGGKGGCMKIGCMGTIVVFLCLIMLKCSIDAEDAARRAEYLAKYNYVEHVVPSTRLEKEKYIEISNIALISSMDQFRNQFNFSIIKINPNENSFSFSYFDRLKNKTEYEFRSYEESHFYGKELRAIFNNRLKKYPTKTDKIDPEMIIEQNDNGEYITTINWTELKEPEDVTS